MVQNWANSVSTVALWSINTRESENDCASKGSRLPRERREKHIKQVTHNRNNKSGTNKRGWDNRGELEGGVRRNGRDPGSAA